MQCYMYGDPNLGGSNYSVTGQWPACIGCGTFCFALKRGDISCGLSKVRLQYDAFPGVTDDYTYRQKNAPSHVGLTTNAIQEC